jgi:phage portal protein BeeE
MKFRSLFEKKQSQARTLIAVTTPGQPVWTPRNYAALAKAGFERNVIAYRCIRLVAEAAASAPLRVVDNGAVMSEHPLIALLAAPNPEQSGATLLETLYGYLETAGNAYIEAVTLGERVAELYALRPDRMKALVGASGWAEGWGGNIPSTDERRSFAPTRTAFRRSCR